MRNHLKSLGSFSWAMSLFGLKNLGALMSFPGFRRRGERSGDAAAGLDAVTKAVTENLGSMLKTIFHSGDLFIKGLVDLSFGRGRRRSAALTMPWLDTPHSGEGPAPPESPFASTTPPNVSSPSPTPSPPVSGWGPMPPIPDTPAASGTTGTAGTTGVPPAKA